MMTKINLVISPSQQPWNKCAMGDSEEDHCFEIGERVAKKMSEDTRFNVLLIPKEAKDFKEAISISNDFIKAHGGRGYHLGIHSDAGGYATGASMLYKTAAGKAFGRPIIQEVMDLTPWEDVGLKYRDNLAELNDTIAVAGILEISFHDNKKEAEWIHNNIDNISAIIVKGIYKSFNLQPHRPGIRQIVYKGKTLNHILPVQPMVVNNYTMVPIAMLRELGYIVKYIPADNAVVITESDML